MSTGEQGFTATRGELLDALTHLIADVPWPSEISQDGTITLDAESMADAIIEGLAAQRRHTVHYRWPVLCGQSASAGDTWSGNLDLVTCPACLGPAAANIRIVDEAEEFGFGRNAAPPWATATYLDEVRLRSRKVGANGGPGPGRADRRHRANEQSARDVPRLVAAIDAALRLASELDTEDGYDASDGASLGEVISRGDRIRDAITTALLETRMIV